MINFIVLGKNKHVIVPVLQAIRSFTDAKAITVGSEETRNLKWSVLSEQHLTIRFDGSEDEAFVSLINGLSEKIRYVTLIPADCDAIRLVNRVRDRLSLQITPIPVTPTLDMFDDKWRFHQFCRQNQVAVPQTRLFESKTQLDYASLASEFGLPFVVKPVNQAGSHGVQIIGSKAQFEQEIRNNDAYCYTPLIAQQYVQGADIDISLLADRGQVTALAIQQADGSTVEFVAHRALEDMAARLCQASAFSGVMHIDARIDRHTGEVVLLESNPRFWASLNASVACGLNFVAESVQPSPRRRGVRRLTSGSSHTSHPVLNPSTWPRLFSDAGDRGRLLRAMSFDPYALAILAKTLPSLAWSRLARTAAGKLKVGKAFSGLIRSALEQKRLTKN